MSKAPIFILGFPRSGTSLLRIQMTCHPHLVIPPECSFVTWLAPLFEERMRVNGVLPSLQGFLDSLTNARKFDTWGLGTDAVETEILLRRPEDYASVCSCVFRAYARWVNKPAATWGDKNNAHLNHVSTLVRLYPKARFILIVRDPRDVLVSLRESARVGARSRYGPAAMATPDEFGRSWNSAHVLALKDLESLPAPQWTAITYEDLVRRNEATLRKVLSLLDLDWNADMLDFHRHNREQGLEPEETLPWKELTRKPLTDTRVGRWKRELSAIDAKTVVKDVSSIWGNFGYQ